MRDLIRKVLREFTEPILVYEIKLKQNLQEAEYFVRFIKKDQPEIVLMKNDHSMDGISNSGFSRVDPDLIDDSIREFEDEIVTAVKKVLKICKKGECSMIVRDKVNGFDYHMWLDKKTSESIYMTINTSIHHPNKLGNKKRSPVLIIYQDGGVNLNIL